MVGGQKIPLDRPRVRDTRKKEVPLGSYELIQRASLMEESVWKKIMHGLTTRRYSQIIEELEQAFGIKKSTISEHFIEASRQRLDTAAHGNYLKMVEKLEKEWRGRRGSNPRPPT